MADKKPSQEEEPKQKMYRFTLKLDFETSSIDGARKMAVDWMKARREADDTKEIAEKNVERVVRAKYSSRADRLAEAISKINDAISEIEELKGECDEWYNNLPENFQSGEKGEMLQSAVSALEDLQGELESAVSNGESVEFPGMFG